MLFSFNEEWFGWSDISFILYLRKGFSKDTSLKIPKEFSKIKMFNQG